MLNDLRRILEEDNRIESDLELMMEGTDADMVEMFIDEDGEAEIPESELTKILTKIPEYNQEEELNKKLKRLTESVIPDYEILEEKSTLKDKIIRFRDDVRDDNPVAYDAILGAYLLGVPGLVIGLVGSDFIRDKVADRLQTKAAVYTKGEPLRKEKITELLNACRTKKDIKKFEKWLKKVYRNLKVVTQDDPEIQANMDEFRDWIRDEILQKQLKVKKARIKSGIVESFDDFDDEYEYDFMTDEEFCEAMEAEYDEYLNIISEQDDFDGFDDDFDDDFFLEESKSEKEGVREKLYRNEAAKLKTIAEVKQIIKKNNDLHKKMTTVMKAKLKEADENKVKSVLKDLKSYVVLGLPIIGTKLALNPGEKSPKAVLAHAIENNRICDKVLKERLKELKSGKKGVKESYILDLTDEPDYII